MNTYEIFKSLVPSTLLHTQQSWIILAAKGSTWKISSGIILANFCRFAFLLCLYQLSFSFSSQALWPHIWWLFFFPFYCLDWIMDVFWSVDLAFDLAIHMMLYMSILKLHILKKTPRMLAYLSHSPIQRRRSDRIVLSHLKIICWHKGKFSDWFILWTFWQKVLQKVSRWWQRNNLNLPSIVDTTNL